MIYNHFDGKCIHIKFSIFDYAIKKFIYVGTYEQLEYVNKFNVEIFYGLVKNSINLVEFERAPFKRHIAVVQSVLNMNWQAQLTDDPDWRLCPSSSSSEWDSSSSDESVTPPPIIVERDPFPKPETRDGGVDPKSDVEESDEPEPIDIIVKPEEPKLLAVVEKVRRRWKFLELIIWM